MSEPISLVPGVIGISAKTAKALVEYSKKVKDAPKQILSIVLEVKTLKAVLETLQETIDQFGNIASKTQLSECLEQCKTTLQELEMLVQPEEEVTEVLRTRNPEVSAQYTSIRTIARGWRETISSEVGSSHRNARHSSRDPSGRPQLAANAHMSTSDRLKWPIFQQEKANELLERLKRHNSQLSLALDVDNAMNLNSITKSVREIESTLNDNEKRAVLAWLKPPKLDMRDVQMEQHAKQEDETCGWITDSVGWDQWLQGGSDDPEGYRRFIWIYGIPGAGKTVLASFLIDEIAKKCQYTGLSYYYCYHERNQDETIPLLRWIVGDLSIQAKRFIPRELEELYDSETFTIPGLLSCLLAFCRWFREEGRRVYLVVDAVDESLKPRKRLVDLLIKIGTDSSFDNVSLLMTSRDEDDIRTAMEDLDMPLRMKPTRSFDFEDDLEILRPYTSITMSNGEVQLAIQTYVHKQFARNSHFKMWPREFRQNVENNLARNARGMFRWVACQIDLLERSFMDTEQVTETLKNMPTDLFATYAKILEKIPSQQHPFARTALALICSNTSNIKSADVLVQASLHNVVQGQVHNFNVGVLKKILGCLIKVVDLRKRPDRKFPGEDDGIPLQKVSVAHYTVREFLFAQPKVEDGPRPAGEFALSDAEIRTLEMQVIFNGLQRWGMSRQNPRFVSRYEEHCLEMSDNALREGRRGLLIRDENVWKSVVPCLSPSCRHIRELTNQKLRRAFPRWKKLFAFEELPPEAYPNGKPPPPLRQETGILASSVLLGWPEFARKYVEDPGFKTLSRRTKQSIWTDRFTVDSAIEERAARYLPKKSPMTLIRLCVLWKRVEFLSIFVDAGADFNYEPNIIHRALHDPYGLQDDDGRITGRMLKTLLEAGADPNPPGCLYSPLQYAVNLLEEGWVQTLLLEGRNANATGDPSGKHPLHGKSESWHNQHPLEICATASPDWGPGQDEEVFKARKQIRLLLTQYGAKRPANPQPTEMPPMVIDLEDS